MNQKTKKPAISTTQKIVLSFFCVILIGGLLLSTPLASADGTVTPLIDALFTATTSVCVTGLVTVTTAFHWSLFGQILILFLVQLGGLGVAALTMLFFLSIGKRLSLSSRKLIVDSFNLDSLGGITHFLRRVFLGTVIVEGIGALCYLPVFISDYGIRKGIWFSVFHSVSAFCNAGLDLIGSDSLIPYAGSLWFNLVTMMLIILGGLGFIVWRDLLYLLKGRKKRLSLHSRIVLRFSAFLILFGSVCFFIFEYHNPDTIGGMSLPHKILASLFQSVTSRTAGFAGMSQSALTSQSVFIMLMLMFIGGSPVGTAGGVKTTTIFVLLATIRSTIRGDRDTNIFGRRIPAGTIRKSLAVASVSLLTSLTALLLMFLFAEGSATDIVYEVVSAVGTVGLSRDFTATLNFIGKCIILVCMFFGRIGPMSLVIALTAKSKNETVRLAEEDITVG
ncbi:MAG: potassium transporter TrkG [Lachnospiraceae bacterium]|nr:potassium transporter TrkG [Lachnospiraceae bacterium]